MPVSRIAGIEITNPTRVVYPNHQFTKLNVVEYYARVAKFILPNLTDRPVTLKRYPDTTVGPVFYEKDAPEFTPSWVKTFPVARRGGDGDIHYIVISDERTLVWTASIGTLEIHPFLARSADIEAPTEVVFDLDPGEGVNIVGCARVALLLRDLLSQLQLDCFPKVSGSAGVQVYVPLNTPATYSVTQPFARAAAELLHQQHPELIVSEMQRSERRGKVFIDWSQNADFKTTIGVYSLRAKRHRPFVSLPVTWNELTAAIEANDSGPLYWYAWEALDRLNQLGDLFSPVLTLKQVVPQTFVEQIGATVPHVRAANVGPSSRHKKTSTGAPSFAKRKVGVSPKSHDLPRSSAQGGRRRFLLRAATTGVPRRESALAAGVPQELAVERDDDWRCWSLPQGLPAARTKARAQQSTFCIADTEFDLILKGVHHGVFPAGVLDIGTYELVEGNLAGDYAHLYFTGLKLKGDLYLLHPESASPDWIANRVFLPIALSRRKDDRAA